jgi:NAD+ kinase
VTQAADRADSGNEIKRIGVLGRSAHEDVPDCVARIARFAADNTLDIRYEEHLLAHIPEGAKALNLDDEAVDFLIAFGGDGTLLRAGRMAAGRDIPVLGVNVGHLGFLTALPLGEMEERLTRVLGGDFVLDRRFMVEAKLIRSGGVEDEPILAWNDFVIHKRGVARVTRLGLRVSEGGNWPEAWQEVGSFSGDGLIVSTPTGSTAYSLSAGGPIVVPTVDCLVATPVCPHTLAVRPLVLPGSQILAVSPLERTDDLVLTADGQMAYELEMGMEVQFTRSSVEVPLVRFSDQNFFGTLQRKLNWAARPSG